MDLRLAMRALVATLVGATSVLEGQTATQVVRFQVNAVSQIAVSGNPAPLVVNSATAGSTPTPATAAGTTYAITTNQTNQKILASLDQGMPSGVTLEVALGAPAGAASAGVVALSTAPADVVTGITATTAVALPITYRLSATSTVLLTAAEVRTVTFTIVAGS